MGNQQSVNNSNMPSQGAAQTATTSPNQELSSPSSLQLSSNLPMTKKERKKSLKNTRDNLNNLILKDLRYIQLSLINLDGLIDQAIKQIRIKHDNLLDSLHGGNRTNEYSISTLCGKFKYDIIQKRNVLVDELKQKKKITLDMVDVASPFLHRNIMPTFLENTKSFYNILMDSMYNVNPNFTLMKKVKYLKFFSDYEMIDARNGMVQNCYNSVIIPFSRNRIFYALAIFDKKSFMKITDRHGNDLYKRPISKTHFYREFLVFGKHVAGLFEDHTNSNSNIIQIYDDELRLISERSFDHKFKLLYLNKYELVCKSMLNPQQYFFFNFNLDQTFSFRIQAKQTANTHDDIVLLGANQIEIFLFNAQKKFLKIINRISGQTMGSIDFDAIDIKVHPQAIKFDRTSNFLFKSLPQLQDNSIKYFDYQNKILVDGYFDMLKLFNCFDLTLENDVYTCDNLNKKIYFF